MNATMGSGQSDSLTPRMAEALVWLRSVGKASPSTLRRHGYSARTLDALAQRGLVRIDWQGGARRFPVYRLVSDDREARP